MCILDISNVIGALAALFFINHSVVIGKCNQTVSCNRTPVIGQLKLILKKEKKLGNFQNRGIFHFKHSLAEMFIPKFFSFLEIVTVMISW